MRSSLRSGGRGWRLGSWGEAGERRAGAQVAFGMALALGDLGEAGALVHLAGPRLGLPRRNRPRRPFMLLAVASQTGIGGQGLWSVPRDLVGRSTHPTYAKVTILHLWLDVTFCPYGIRPSANLRWHLWPAAHTFKSKSSGKSTWNRALTTSERI